MEDKTKRDKVLIACDDPEKESDIAGMFYRIISRNFGSQGYIPLVYNNRIGVGRRLNEKSDDVALVIVGNTSNGYDDLDFAKRYASSLFSIKFIILSSNRSGSQNRLEKKASEAGVFKFIRKPFDVSKIAEIIRSALNIESAN